ncbi:Solute carrier family 40 member 3, chloroplastic, partial [Linum perenne]
AASQLLSASIIIHAHSVPSNVSSSIVIRPWFVLLVIAGSIERLCGVALAITNSRYWVVQLAGRERPLALAQANAVLIRIQLLSELVGASIFGVLLCKYDPVTCLKFASTFIIGSLPITIGLTVLTDRLSTGVLSDTIISDHQAILIVGRFVETLKLGLREYIEQPVLPASVAYVIGSFNVVLCPGSLMTAFLTQRGYSFWVDTPDFITCYGCYSVLEWISFKSQSDYLLLLRFDCIIEDGKYVKRSCG